MYAYFDRFSIKMTKQQALDCSHPGPCDAEVKETVKELRRQLAKIPAADIREELKGYGAWGEEELQDHDENLKRIVWIAAGNIREEL